MIVIGLIARRTRGVNNASDARHSAQRLVRSAATSSGERGRVADGHWFAGFAAAANEVCRVSSNCDITLLMVFARHLHELTCLVLIAVYRIFKLLSQKCGYC